MISLVPGPRLGRHRIGPGLRRRRRGVLVALTALLLTLSAVTLTGPRAWSDTLPPDPGIPATVSTDLLPTVQIDGVVWSQAVAGDTVFAGGNFSSARPAGAAAGTSTVRRSHLLSYNIKTGLLDSAFAPTLDGQVRAVALSPDHQTLYVGGDFLEVNGQSRSRLAAFDVASGALKTGFAPTTNGQVRAIVATTGAVYLGGDFTTVNGVTRVSVASVRPADGALLTFHPIVQHGSGEAIAVLTGSSKVVIAGRFDTVNGSANPGYGMAIVDAATGRTNYPMSVNSIIRDAHAKASVLSLWATPDGGFYGGGFSFSSTDGNFEGAFKANQDGELTWLEDCHGDTYSVFPSNGALYIAGHPHY